MASIINADTSNGLKLTSDTSGQLEFQSAGSTKLTMASGGNLTTVGTVTQNSTASGDIAIFKTTANSGTGLYLNSQTSGQLDIVGYNGSGANILNLRAGGATNSGMRIDTNGDIRFKTPESNNGFRYNVATDTAGGYGQNYVSSTGTKNQWTFNNPNGEVGRVTTNGSSTAYNTSSDYRLKENVNYTWDATARLKELKPARFNFIADSDTTVDGFLAHEVNNVVPEAVSGIKDATDDEGNPIYQGIDQSKLVPLLVKTIQELELRITELENA